MSESRIVQNIFELLKQAQETTDVVLTIEERPTIVEMEGTDTPENCWAGRQSMNRYLDEGNWRTDGGFPEIAGLGGIPLESRRQGSAHIRVEIQHKDPFLSAPGHDRGHTGRRE